MSITCSPRVQTTCERTPYTDRQHSMFSCARVNRRKTLRCKLPAAPALLLAIRHVRPRPTRSVGHMCASHVCRASSAREGNPCVHLELLPLARREPAALLLENPCTWLLLPAESCTALTHRSTACPLAGAATRTVIPCRDTCRRMLYKGAVHPLRRSASTIARR